MSEEELKTQLENEIRSLCDTNSSVMTYMECLMRRYEQLQTQLQQKENIIKEVREKLNTQLAFTSSYQLNYQSAMSIIEEAKQILNKENK